MVIEDNVYFIEQITVSGMLVKKQPVTSDIPFIE